MKKRLLLSLLLFCINRTFAQQNQLPSGITKSDANGFIYTTFSDDPAAIRIYQLKNGMQVWVSVNKAIPRIQTAIAVKTGSANDPPHHTGLAHYLEHLMFKGTDKYGTIDYGKEKPLLDEVTALFEIYDEATDEGQRKIIFHKIDSLSWLAARYAIPNEYDKIINSLGAKGTNAFTLYDETVFVNDIPSNEENKWLQIESERLRNPVFRLFPSELEAIYEEKNRHVDSDPDKVDEVLFAGLFKNHTYGTQTTIGMVQDLKNPSLVQIYKYFHTYYVPDNMSIIIAGDLDPDQTIKWVDSDFNQMQPAPVPLYAAKPEVARTEPEVKAVIGADAESVTLGFRFPGQKSQTTVYLDLISELLNNDAAGLVNYNLVKRQKVLNASCRTDELKDYSVFEMNAKPREGQKLEDCKDLLISQLDSLKQGHFDENLIGGAIINLEEDRLRSFENNKGRVFTMLAAYINNVPWDKLMSEFDDMKKISKRDIIDFANNYFTSDYVIVYKRTGKDTTEEKMPKLRITPIKPDVNATSDFAKKIMDEPAPEIQPVFLDYKKDITVDTINHHLPLYYVKNTGNRLFNIFYVFEMGTNNDKKISYALTYMQYLGIFKVSADQLNKRFYELGCNFSVQTGSDQVYVSLSGLDENMDAALQLFEDLLNHCTADDSALHTMLTEELESRADAKQNKNYIRTLLQEYGMYGSLNPSNNVMSNAQIVSLNSTELVSEIHSLENYKHKVFYYGPRDIKTIESIITKYHFTPGKLRDYPPGMKFTSVEPKANKIYFMNYEMGQAEIEWVRKVSDWNPKLIPAIRLFNQYFDEDKSSVVFQNMREEHTPAYATYAQFTIPVRESDPHFIICDVAAQTNKTDSVIMTMNGFMNTLPESEQTFEDAKEAIKNQIQMERIIRTDILFNYETAQRRGINYDLRKNIYEDVPKMTFADMQTFFNTYYKGQSFTYCVLGPQDKMDLTKLNQFGPVNQLNLNDLFGY